MVKPIPIAAPNADLLKPVHWMRGSKQDLISMPKAVQGKFGYALYLAQLGSRHRRAKVLAGFGGANVIEIVAVSDGGSFRAVYTVRFEEAVYVLHVFQKKSKKGIATPAREIDIIKSRLREAELDYASWIETRGHK